MFCKHNWSYLHTVTTPSKLEIMRKNGITFKHGSESLIHQEHKAVFACDKCGKLKVVTTRN